MNTIHWRRARLAAACCAALAALTLTAASSNAVAGAATAVSGRAPVVLHTDTALSAA